MSEQPWHSTKNFRLVAPFRNLLVTRILFGLYNGCFRHVFVRYFARVYCFVVSITICTYLTTYTPRTFYFYICGVVHWITNVFISLLTGEELFFRFCTGIKQIDIKLKLPVMVLSPSTSRFIFTTLIIIKSSILILLTAAYAAGYFQYYVWLHYLTTSYIWTALNLSHVNTFIIYEISTHRTKLLRVFFQTSLSKPCLKRQDSVSHKIKIIWEGMQIYKCILGNIKSTLIYVKFQVVLIVCFIFVGVLMYCYDGLHPYPAHKLIIGTVMMEYVISCVLCCLPALFVEKAGHEVDNINKVFEDELLICNDAVLQVVIENSKDYLSLCPLKNTMRRAYSFDMNLPFAFFSLFTSFMIVMIQK